VGTARPHRLFDNIENAGTSRAAARRVLGVVQFRRLTPALGDGDGAARHPYPMIGAGGGSGVNRVLHGEPILEIFLHFFAGRTINSLDSTH
jgi:hypothetical protein